MGDDYYQYDIHDFEGGHNEYDEMEENEFEDEYEDEVDFESDYDERDEFEDEYGNNMDDYKQYNHEYEQYNKDDDFMENALENGDDFMGNDESLSDEMWKIESTVLFMFIGVLFCFMTFCFVWRSKFGELIRKLNEQRINRNRRIFEAKNRGNNDSDDSSSLNISDVA